MKKQTVSIIAAMTKDRVIGKDNGLPWKIPEDLKNFKRLTSGNTIIMGKNTYESIGRPLPKRNNVVVSSSMRSDKIDVCTSLEEAINKGQEFEKEIFLIGGARIYQEGLAYADRMYLSHVKGDYAGDTFFPEFSADDWNITERKDFPDFEFVVYEKL